MTAHRHTCFVHYVNGPVCRCETPGGPWKCGRCPQEQPMIFKEELHANGGTKMVIHRYHGEPGSGQRGGLQIDVTSGAIEDWMKETSKPRAREKPTETIKEYVLSPELYVPQEPGIYTRGWGDGNGFSHGGKFYHPIFDVTDELVSLEGRVNMSFLRAVGLTEGATFRLEGVFPLDLVSTYAQVFTKMADRFYSQILKSFSVTILIQPGVQSAVAAK